MELLKKYLLMISAITLMNTSTACLAEPVFKVTSQLVIARAIPPPFVVDDYQGVLKWGHEKITFSAPGGVIRWDAWDDPHYLSQAEKAVYIVQKRALNNSRCNHFFATKMPAGKTFAEIWRATGEKRIRISFSPGSSGVWRAATYGRSAPYEWTITETAVKLGPESIASAMVHEATRTNGIGGGKDQYIAYQAERVCGMKQFIFNISIIKQLGWEIENIE